MELINLNFLLLSSTLFITNSLAEFALSTQSDYDSDVASSATVLAIFEDVDRYPMFYSEVDPTLFDSYSTLTENLNNESDLESVNLAGIISTVSDICFSFYDELPSPDYTSIQEQITSAYTSIYEEQYGSEPTISGVWETSEPTATSTSFYDDDDEDDYYYTGDDDDYYTGDDETNTYYSDDYYETGYGDYATTVTVYPEPSTVTVYRCSSDNEEEEEEISMIDSSSNSRFGTTSFTSSYGYETAVTGTTGAYRDYYGIAKCGALNEDIESNLSDYDSFLETYSDQDYVSAFIDDYAVYWDETDVGSYNAFCVDTLTSYIDELPWKDRILATAKIAYDGIDQYLTTDIVVGTTTIPAPVPGASSSV